MAEGKKLASNFLLADLLGTKLLVGINILLSVRKLSDSEKACQVNIRRQCLAGQLLAVST